MNSQIKSPQKKAAPFQTSKPDATFIPIMKKKGSQQSRQAKTPNSESLREALNNAQSAQEGIDLLIRKSLDFDDPRHVSEVVSKVISFPLTYMAQSKPYFAVNQLILRITGRKPLLMSFLSAVKAEIFMDKIHMERLTNNLPRGAKVDPTYSPSARDLQRRAKAFMQAPFQLLRDATLQGLSTTQQQEMLQLASTLTPTLSISREQWKVSLLCRKRTLNQLRLSAKGQSDGGGAMEAEL
jgi:hypothetical protein